MLRSSKCELTNYCILSCHSVFVSPQSVDSLLTLKIGCKLGTVSMQTVSCACAGFSSLLSDSIVSTSAGSQGTPYPIPQRSAFGSGAKGCVGSFPHWSANSHTSGDFVAFEPSGTWSPRRRESNALVEYTPGLSWGWFGGDPGNAFDSLQRGD